MDQAPNLDRYFARIDYQGPRTATRETLRRIVLHHARAIPFENLQPLLRRPVELDLPSLEQKLVLDRRGGYCFEHNTLLWAVLEALGFRVSGLAARVRWNVPEHVITPRGHMLLRVELAEGPHLVDVGFGGLTLTGVLQLTPYLEQETPHEPFRLMPAEEWLELQAQVQGSYRPLYRFTLERQFAPDYQVSNYFLSTSPSSLFLNFLMAARADVGRRYALRDNVLTVHHLDGAPTERRVLSTPSALRAVLEQEFLLKVPTGPDVDALFERLTTGPVDEG